MTFNSNFEGGRMLEKELLEEYVENKFPEVIYGKPSLETYLFIYDSYEYRVYVLRKAFENLKNSFFNKS